MATIRHHARIDAAPDAVWDVVSDAGAISTWFPLIELEDDGGSLVVCSTDVTPDEVADQMDGVVSEGVQGLKAHLES